MQADQTVPTRKGRRSSGTVHTLSDLVEAIQDGANSDAEVVAVMEHLFRTRRVRLGQELSSRRVRVAH